MPDIGTSLPCPPFLSPCPVASFYTFEQLQNWPSVAAELSPPARLAVIGDPIGHSKSPQMHNPALKAAGIDAQYIRVQVPSGHVKEAFQLFRQNGFLGVNITIPHKFEALEAVDEIDPLAKTLGAVNTLVINPDGTFHGHNTDGPGFVASTKEAFGVDLQGLRVLILGAGGGAGRAVTIQCAALGAHLILANRTVSKAHSLREEILQSTPNIEVKVAEVAPDSPYLCDATDLSKTDLIVNATSLGMKDNDAPLIPSGVLRPDQMVYDMVYRKDGETDLIKTAREVGAKNVDGMSLLLHQGAISFTHWFHQPAPLEVMREGLKSA